MKYCPILSFQADRYCEIGCREDRCAFSDEAGDCLIKQALQCYVSAERTRVAEENDRLRRETELAKIYWALKKDGTRSPIQFLKDGDMTPYVPPANTEPDPEYPKIDMYDEPVPGGIRWAHQPTTKKYPHGGWFEDLSNMREKYDIGPIPDAKNPIRQVKTSEAETGVGY